MVHLLTGLGLGASALGVVASRFRFGHGVEFPRPKAAHGVAGEGLPPEGEAAAALRAPPVPVPPIVAIKPLHVVLPAKGGPDYRGRCQKISEPPPQIPETSETDRWCDVEFLV